MIADLSLADLLKIYSAATGRLINVKADGSVQFISSLNATAFELNDIVAFKSVKRTFSDYAQNNIVRFKESNNVNESEQIKVEYQIENDNIEEEKELLKLNPTEGGLYDDGTDNLLYVRGMKPERDEGVHAWIYTLTDEVVASFGGNEFLQRISLTKSNLLQTLCDKSTQFVVDARMSLAQFSTIDSATCLLVRGTKYTWVEASY